MRAPWDAYFLNLARAAAARSTCSRANVGAVLVIDKQVIATGYNGSISGTPHCDDENVGHLLIDNSCQRAEHAERNCVASAAKRGVATENAHCFCTHFPCWPCFRILVQAGVSKIVFAEWKNNRMTPEIYKLICETPVELVDSEGRKFQDIVKVVDGKVLPE